MMRWIALISSPRAAVPRLRSFKTGPFDSSAHWRSLRTNSTFAP